MKLIVHLLLLTPLLFITACGCQGYGYPEPTKPDYLSLLVLKDTVDFINTVEYESSAKKITTNAQTIPLYITNYEPAFIHVKTIKHAFSFRVKTGAKYSYFNDRHCDEGEVNITYNAPIIDSVTGGKIIIKRANLGSPNPVQTPKYTVDSIIFIYP